MSGVRNRRWNAKWERKKKTIFTHFPISINPSVDYDVCRYKLIILFSIEFGARDNTQQFFTSMAFDLDASDPCVGCNVSVSSWHLSKIHSANIGIIAMHIFQHRRAPTTIECTHEYDSVASHFAIDGFYASRSACRGMHLGRGIRNAHEMETTRLVGRRHRTCRLYGYRPQ